MHPCQFLPLPLQVLGERTSELSISIIYPRKKKNFVTTLKMLDSSWKTKPFDHFLTYRKTDLVPLKQNADSMNSMVVSRNKLRFKKFIMIIEQNLKFHFN